MNRADTTMLLRRLHTNYALLRPADNDTIDEWQRQLAGIEATDAFAALDRLVQTEAKAPSCARLIVEIRARVPATHKDPGSIGNPDCGMCDGTGFMLTRDPDVPFVDRYAPCAMCRPDHPWHRRAKPAGEPPVHFAMMDGAEERRAAWRSGDRDRYAAVMRHQFGKDGIYRPNPDGAA